MTDPSLHGHTLADLEHAQPFSTRHIGPGEDETAKMLAVVGAGSLEELADLAVPDVIRAQEGLDLPAAGSETEVLAELRALAGEARYEGRMPAMREHKAERRGATTLLPL